jgi:HSP20 family protein
MLTRYYNSVRTPVIDLFDTFRLFDEIDSGTHRKADSIDESGIKIEMPGVRPSDVDVTVEGRTLRVVGKSRHGKEFSYSYSLKPSVDSSAVSAKLQDGLLEITLPKKPDDAARKISVL